MFTVRIGNAFIALAANQFVLSFPVGNKTNTN